MLRLPPSHRNDPFARGGRGATREDRVRALLETARSLSHEDDPRYRRLAHAIRAWLGGEAPTIEAALQVQNPKHSHRTAQRIVHDILRREALDAEDADAASDADADPF